MLPKPTLLCRTNIGSFCAVNPEDMKKLSGTLTALSSEKAKALKVCSNLHWLKQDPHETLNRLQFHFSNLI